VTEATIRGPATAVPLEEQSAWSGIERFTTPRERLRAYVRFSCSVLARTSPIMPIIERRTRPTRWWLGRLLLIFGLASCGGGDGPPSAQAPETTGTLSGIVRSSVDGTPVAGATVSIRNRSTTSGSNGEFQLERVPTGSTTLTCSRAGFDEYSAFVFIDAGAHTHQVTLSLLETYAAGNHTIYVPARAPTIHGLARQPGHLRHRVLA
jgi:hypothetical protein